MAHAFICYARKDEQQVLSIVQRLKDAKRQVWIDREGLSGGVLYGSKIAQEISKCSSFILFLSEASVQSDYVRKELDFAIRKGKRIIPVRLDDVALSDEFQFEVGSRQAIDFAGDKIKGADELLSALNDVDIDHSAKGTASAGSKLSAAGSWKEGRVPYLSPCLSPLRSGAMACDMRANQELVHDAGLPRRSMA